MRLPILLFAAMLVASPALADEPPVVVLRGSSAPPTPQYEPPPPPQIETVYVPVYYLPLYGPFVQRHHHAHFAKRNR